VRKIGFSSLALLLALAVTGCSVVTPDKRPDDQRLRDGINLLLRNFTDHHADLINWKMDQVKAQISKKLPTGFASEAGWTLKWSNYTQGELPQVVIPWSMVGQYPNHYVLDIDNYSGGKIVPQTTAVEVSHAQSGNDIYLAGIVHQRSAKSDSNWIIFTSVPYLPFTDIAYGFAHRSDGKWSIVDFGTATVGCGRVPATIQSEFGMSCPTGSN